MRLRRAVADADGLLIATPEYNQSVPGVLKNVIDWVEAQGDYVRLHVGDRTHLVSKSLPEMEKHLEARGFLRIHRGALVNLDRLPAWRRGQSSSLVGSVMLTS